MGGSFFLNLVPVRVFLPKITVRAEKRRNKQRKNEKNTRSNARDAKKLKKMPKTRVDEQGVFEKTRKNLAIAKRKCYNKVKKRNSLKYNTLSRSRKKQTVSLIKLKKYGEKKDGRV